MGIVYIANDSNSESFAHWRTKGSKNGVRIWQNEDGSYTPAGKNFKPGGRYNQADEHLEDSVKVAEEAKKYNETHGGTASTAAGAKTIGSSTSSGAKVNTVSPKVATKGVTDEEIKKARDEAKFLDLTDRQKEQLKAIGVRLMIAAGIYVAINGAAYLAFDPAGQALMSNIDQTLANLVPDAPYQSILDPNVDYSQYINDPNPDGQTAETFDELDIIEPDIASRKPITAEDVPGLESPIYLNPNYEDEYMRAQAADSRNREFAREQAKQDDGYEVIDQTDERMFFPQDTGGSYKHKVEMPAGYKTGGRVYEDAVDDDVNYQYQGARASKHNEDARYRYESGKKAVESKARTLEQDFTDRKAQMVSQMVREGYTADEIKAAEDYAELRYWAQYPQELAFLKSEQENGHSSPIGKWKTETTTTTTKSKPDTVFVESTGKAEDDGYETLPDDWTDAEFYDIKGLPSGDRKRKKS